MKNDSDVRQAVAEILRSLKRIFQEYSRTARKNAWKSIMSRTTQREIDSLINSPTKPLISPGRFATFKDWIER